MTLRREGGQCHPPSPLADEKGAVPCPYPHQQIRRGQCHAPTHQQINAIKLLLNYALTHIFVKNATHPLKGGPQHSEKTGCAAGHQLWALKYEDGTSNDSRNLRLQTADRNTQLSSVCEVGGPLTRIFQSLVCYLRSRQTLLHYSMNYFYWLRIWEDTTNKKFQARYKTFKRQLDLNVGVEVEIYHKILNTI